MFDSTWAPEGLKLSKCLNPVTGIAIVPLCSTHWEQKYCLCDVRANKACWTKWTSWKIVHTYTAPEPIVQQTCVLRWLNVNWILS